MVKKLFILAFLVAFSLFANTGKIVAMKGDATIIKGSEQIDAKLGSEIAKNDELKTGKNSKLQLLFDDNTVITIGNNSHFKVNEYLFSDNNVQAEFGLLKGTFRTITGKIGKVAPSKFQLKSKTSSIGIRGTQILSKMAIQGDRIVCIEGEILITHLASGKTIILKAGEFVDVSAKNDTLEVQTLTQEDINDMDENTRFLIEDEKEADLEDLGVVVANNENTGWDEWNEEPDDVGGLYDDPSQQGIPETDPNFVINATHTATYTGKISGGHYTYGTLVGSYLNNSANSFSMDVNFGTRDITNGSMSAQYTDGASILEDSVSGITGTVKADGTGFDIVGPAGTSGMSGTWGGTGSGTFSGAQAEYISGDFSFDDGNTEEMKGTYDASSN